MHNHYYDNTHPLRPYTHSLAATPGTLAPVNALRGKKPMPKPGFWPGEQGDTWVDIEDHRKEEGYVDGKPFTIANLGPYPQGWSTTPSEPTEEEKTQARIAEIDARLYAIDVESVRPLRAVVDDSASDDDRQKLAALEQEAASLRRERTELLNA